MKAQLIRLKEDLYVNTSWIRDIWYNGYHAEITFMNGEHKSIDDQDYSIRDQLNKEEA